MKKKFWWFLTLLLVCLAILFFILMATFSDVPYGGASHGGGLVRPQNPYSIWVWVFGLGSIITCCFYGLSNDGKK